MTDLLTDNLTGWLASSLTDSLLQTSFHVYCVSLQHGGTELSKHVSNKAEQWH